MIAACEWEMTVVRFCRFCWKVSFLPCVPEVLCGLTIVFARLLGLHADSDWTCQRYTFMLVMMFCNGILSKIGWTTSWRCPVWFLLLPFSYYYPLFPPKKNQMRRRRISFVLSSSNFWQSMGRCHRSMLICQAVALYMPN